MGLLYFEARGPLSLSSSFFRHGPATRRSYALLDDAAGQLVGTNKISRYPVKQGANLADSEQEFGHGKIKPGIPRVNKRVNAPKSANGTSPFIGGYFSSAR